MKQTALLNMQEVISFESYDRWLTENSEAVSGAPVYCYVREMCEDNGYEPTGDDMGELEGELMFCIEQYSTLLYAYYREAGVHTVQEANAVSIMATLHNDMTDDGVSF